MRRLALFLLLLAAPPVKAQAGLRSLSAGDVATLALLADSANDVPKLLKVMHPDAVRYLQADAVWWLETFTEERMDSMFRMLPRFSDSMPDPGQLIKRREARLLDTVYQVTSVKELGRLPPESVFARSRRHQGTVRQRPLPRIAGVVTDGDSLAYVVLVARPRVRPVEAADSAANGQASRFDFPRPPQRSGPAGTLMLLRRYRGEWRVAAFDAGWPFPQVSSGFDRLEAVAGP